MKTARERFKKFIEDFYLVLVLVFLYAPILVMMVLSFNSSKSLRDEEASADDLHGTQQYPDAKLRYRDRDLPDADVHRLRDLPGL